MIVTTAADLRSVVKQYMRLDEFVCDLETKYTPTAEEVEKRSLIEARPSKERTVDETKWLELFKLRPTDPQVNEIFWVGLAGLGMSTAIPCGHPKGRLLRKEERVKRPAFELYPEDDKRHWTPGGKPSARMVEVTRPAEFAPPPAQLDVSEVIEIIRPLFFSGKLIINHNLKFDLQTLTKYFDGEVPPYPLADTMIAAHILDERHTDYALGSIVKRAFDTKYEKLGGKGVENFSFRKAARYSQQDARFTYLSWRRLRERLQRSPDLWRLFMDYEMKCYESFIHLELEGVDFDADMAAKLRVEKEQEIQLILEQLIVDYKAPRDFNPNSGPQKADLIYRQHRGPVLKRGESGQPSVDEESLKYVIERRPDGKAASVAQLLLDYAAESKVLGTYLVKQPMQAAYDGRIHANYTLHGTATGRTSCRDPNIQNVPKDSVMREMYMAPPGFVFIGGDYDQVELRKLAVESKDPNMCRLFNENIDLHAGTAALMLHKDVEDVTPSERQELGKMPNFLLSYGGSAYNLMQKTGSTEERAEEVYDMYYKVYSRIPPWKDRVIREAKSRARFKDGRMIGVPYVETMLGRRRRLPELLLAGSDKAERRARAAAERQAVNTIIQGSCAEIAKLAMIDFLAWKRETGFPMALVIMVHDELVATVPERYAEDGRGALERIMTGVRVPHTGELPLKGVVKLQAKVKISERWEK